jgi:hypothetical protein
MVAIRVRERVTAPSGFVADGSCDTDAVSLAADGGTIVLESVIAAGIGAYDRREAGVRIAASGCT